MAKERNQMNPGTVYHESGANAMINATIQIPGDVIAKAIAAQMKPDRHELMVQKYGEACTKAVAAQLLNVHPRTLCNMIRDGRILAACRGERIDVRSLADYIENRTAADHEMRMEKKRGRRCAV